MTVLRVPGRTLRTERNLAILGGLLAMAVARLV